MIRQALAALACITTAALPPAQATQIGSHCTVFGDNTCQFVCERGDEVAMLSVGEANWSTAECGGVWLYGCDARLYCFYADFASSPGFGYCYGSSTMTTCMAVPVLR